MNVEMMAKQMMKMGRRGDTMLAHITPTEAMALKMMGGSGTRNPRTGLREFFTDRTWRPDELQQALTDFGEMGPRSIDPDMPSEYQGPSPLLQEYMDWSGASGPLLSNAIQSQMKYGGKSGTVDPATGRLILNPEFGQFTGAGWQDPEGQYHFTESPTKSTYEQWGGDDTLMGLALVGSVVGAPYVFPGLSGAAGTGAAVGGTLTAADLAALQAGGGMSFPVAAAEGMAGVGSIGAGTAAAGGLAGLAGGSGADAAAKTGISGFLSGLSPTTKAFGTMAGLGVVNNMFKKKAAEDDREQSMEDWRNTAFPSSASVDAARTGATASLATQLQSARKQYLEGAASRGVRAGSGQIAGGLANIENQGTLTYAQLIAEIERMRNTPYYAPQQYQSIGGPLDPALSYLALAQGLQLGRGGGG